MTLRILVAPSGFKECLEAQDVARAIAAGVLRALPSARLTCLPMADGGEGFVRTLVDATCGTIADAGFVTGLDGRHVGATIGLLGGGPTRTAVIEIASAAGLKLVPPVDRNLATATSFGVGELIARALDLGAEAILIGCGDSGVNDGGAGIAQALGVQLLDAEGRTIERGGMGLLSLRRIETSGLDPRLARVRIDAAVNWQNDLLGPHGVTRIYGRQKGADGEQVELLERALAMYAAAIREATGIDVGGMPGAGASGGIGATLAALLGATLRPRLEIITQYLDFDRHLRESDLVITAEGQLDSQSARGKIPGEIGMRARELGIPVFVLAGAVEDGADDVRSMGVTAYASISSGPSTVAEAYSAAEKRLEAAAEQIIRVFIAGRSSARRGRKSRRRA
jgi:glycerate 2-kinase